MEQEMTIDKQRKYHLFLYNVRKAFACGLTLDQYSSALKKFGVTNIRDLPYEKQSDFLKEINA